MSLKGYQWLDENGEVVFSFLFKDKIIDVWKDTTIEELNKFKKFLGTKEKGIDLHFHKIEGYLELED